MKNLIAIMTMVFISITSFSQCPGGMFYQAQVNDINGDPVPDGALVDFDISFDNTGYTYSMDGAVTDNSVLTTYIGCIGDQTDPDFESIDWVPGVQMTVSLTYDGSTISTTSSHIAFVPYAKYADRAATADTAQYALSSPSFLSGQFLDLSGDDAYDAIVISTWKDGSSVRARVMFLEAPDGLSPIGSLDQVPADDYQPLTIQPEWESSGWEAASFRDIQAFLNSYEVYISLGIEYAYAGTGNTDGNIFIQEGEQASGFSSGTLSLETTNFGVDDLFNEPEFVNTTKYKPFFATVTLN